MSRLTSLSALSSVSQQRDQHKLCLVAVFMASKYSRIPSGPVCTALFCWNRSREKLLTVCVVVFAKTPLHHLHYDIASSHLTPAKVAHFSFTTMLTSHFNSIDSRLHFGLRNRKCTWVFAHAAWCLVPTKSIN